MNKPHSIKGLWATMQESTLEPLLKKAKELEKKYEWLQAADCYKKASIILLKDKDFVKAAEFQENLGYCFFRAALQAETKEQFETRMQLASKKYEQTFLIFEKLEGKEAGKNHAKAMVAYTSSWCEHDLSKMEILLDEWWTLENKALSIYEKMQNPLDIGKTCNNILEYSVDRQIWFIWFNTKEYVNRYKKLLDIGEKAIAALRKTNYKYEIARAYCWTGWFYGRGPKGQQTLKDHLKKSQNYSKKALSLAKEIGDGWLIGWSYNAISEEFGLSAKNFTTWLNQGIKVLEQGRIIKDNYMMVTGKWKAGMIIYQAIKFEEDPEKKRQTIRKAIKWTSEAIAQAKLINFPIGILLSQTFHCRNLISLAWLEPNLQEKRKLTLEAVKLGREGVEYSKGRAWFHSIFLLESISRALLWLSRTETNLQERRKHLEEALKIRKDFDKIVYFGKSLEQAFRLNFSEALYQTAQIISEIAKIETNHDKKTALFNEAIIYWEKCLKIAEKVAEAFPNVFKGKRLEGFYFYDYGDVLGQIYLHTEEKSTIIKAINVYKKASEFFSRFKLGIHEAKSYWKMALINNKLGDYLQSSQKYGFAAKAYRDAIKNTPQLKDFCENYSKYLTAWSQIEQARYYHSNEEYDKAKKNYEKAAKLHELSEPWSYLASNYFAWANMEEAANFSRNEQTELAKQTFKKALQQFNRTEESFKEKLEKISSEEEKEMIQRLLKASDLRREYCHIRILMEEAKLLDREGKYRQSSKKYGEAAQNISVIVDKIDAEAERKELKYIAILCQAWEKMAKAEETASSESYMEAAKLFEKAKNFCYTRKASLWALGNSNFCRGLAAGIEYQISVNLADHARAKSLLKSAGTSYLQAGFKNASEYTKATQRLFDAYVFMNQAESEADQEKRAKQYQMAENLLQISAGSFMKAKQPEKTDQVKEILVNVREEKKLAISLSQVMQAPTIASTTQSFTAPTPTSEASVGLESFEHANVQANLVAAVREVKVGESFCLSVEFVNAGREPALLTRVEDFVPHDFVVVKKPEIYRIEKTTLNMKGKQIAPLKLVEVKLTLQPSKKGNYQLNPRVHYLDELGQNRSLQLKTLGIKVEEVLLEDRISTGTQELNSLLLGGIPSEYAVVLTGPPSDEREYLIRNFLETGIRDDEIVFYVSTEADRLEHLLEKSNFCLFLCNPKPKTEVPDLSNVYKLRSKTDLTNLSISLAKAYRNIEPSSKKRICVEIVSNVLLDYEAKATCMWVSELITDLGAKGFTMLAVMNPGMHPSDQATAVIDLFDGEIELTQTEDPLECRKSVRVKKLRNQDYIKNPICLT